MKAEDHEWYWKVYNDAKKYESQRSESSGKPSAWVGLTWEDANEIAIAHDVRPSTIKAIEAKLKEKNT